MPKKPENPRKKVTATKPPAPSVLVATAAPPITPPAAVAKRKTKATLALGKLWSQVIGDTVPPHMSQVIQRRFLAYAIQARAEGDVSASIAKRFDRMVRGDIRPVTAILRPGGRLLRQWNGTTHVIDVVEGGFLWHGSQHRSLSAIARAITGTRWSGPRFFGLTDAAAKASAAEKPLIPKP